MAGEPGPRFVEEEWTIGREPFRLGATLTLPEGSGPFPAVVLVHGSGPNDRDETLGPNKPFRDLAWGLAERGTAVLRYEKRTRQYPHEMSSLESLTVWEETIEDAGLAYQALGEDRRLNPAARFILGHSFAGYLLPRIAQAVPTMAGMILWAPMFRPLEVVMTEQIDYILGLEGTTDEDRAALTAMREQAQLIGQFAGLDSSAAELAPLGVPASYWRDLAQYNPGAVFREGSIPALILRGEADYQVTGEDINLWRRASDGKPQVTVKQYPHLTHTFIWTERDIAVPATYAVPGRVAQAVVEDISAWIHAIAGEGSRSQ